MQQKQVVKDTSRHSADSQGRRQKRTGTTCCSFPPTDEIICCILKSRDSKYIHIGVKREKNYKYKDVSINMKVESSST